jgi:Arc/MetJ-type ribon-helix-helix transcriptional regulator
MRTINISVTDEQRKYIDQLVSKLDFANRSEFFRTIIRRVRTSPELMEEPKVVQLSAKAIKRYNKMIDDIESGRELTYKTENVSDLLDQLHGRKSPVLSKVSKKL